MRTIFAFCCILAIQSVTIAQSGKAFRLLKAGRFQEAINYNLDKVEKTKNPIKYHQTLARAYALLGDDIQSEREYKKALSYVDQKPWSKLRLKDFDIMDELALLSVRIGSWQQSRELALRSLEQRVKWWSKNDPVNYRPYLPLGMLYFANGLTDSAKYYLNTYKYNLRNSNYTGHLDVDKYADVFQLLADISINENDLKEALHLSKKSLRLQNHVWTKREVGKNYADRIKALNTITKVYIKSGEYIKARRSCEKAEGMLENVGGRQLLYVDTYLNMARLEVQDGNITKAKKLLVEVMSYQIEFVNNTMIYLSEYEKQNIYSHFKINSDRIMSQVYDLYDNNLINSNDSLLSNTLDFIINTKAVILNEANKVRSKALSSSDESLSHILSEWKRLKYQWQYLTSAAKKSSRGKIDELHSRLVEIEKSLAAKFNTKPVINWKAIQNNLKDDELALEMVQVTKTDSINSFMIFKVTSDCSIPEIKQLTIPRSMDKQMEYYFNAIKYHVVDTLTYSLIWKPMEVSPSIKKVYLSPSGAFHLMNFNTIRTTQGDFLANTHTIVNITNIAGLANIQSHKPRLKSAILVGVSDFQEWRESKTDAYLHDLPGVKQEVTQIDSILSRVGVTTTVMLNNPSTERMLNETKDFSILHLASHGLTNIKHANPMLGSGLVLTKSNALDNGSLSAYEASLLNLEKTQLVVLSACSSGIGKVLEGEGVYGLQRAFEVAGVKNIIMSMWDIDDSFTQFFMNTFYNNLIENENVFDAFSETTREALQHNSNPRLWGAFKLVQCH